MLTLERLDQIVARAPGLRVAVVGDFFLDRYLVTDPALAEVSIETGLEARQVVEMRASPGAAGTVTSNLAALGVGTIHAVGGIGDDGEGFTLRRALEATGVRTDRLRADATRFTPTYVKPMARAQDGGERELERLDIKNRKPLPATAEARVIADLRDLLAAGLNAVIIADQVQERNCGVITDRLRETLAKLAAEYAAVLFFADSRVRIGEYRGITIKPNQHEAAAAMGHDGALSLEEAGDVGKRLAARNGRPVYLTCGAEGILVCTAEGAECAPALRVSGPIDIVGAGDSATAGIVCGLCSGATPLEAAALGNLCASVTIRKLGTTGTASPDELRARLREVGA